MLTSNGIPDAKTTVVVQQRFGARVAVYVDGGNASNNAALALDEGDGRAHLRARLDPLVHHQHAHASLDRPFAQLQRFALASIVHELGAVGANWELAALAHRDEADLTRESDGGAKNEAEGVYASHGI